MTPAERQARRRERMQERGYRQASVFVPRCMLPGQLLEACNQWLIGKTALCERADTGWIPAQVLETDREIQEVVDDLDAEFGSDEWYDRYCIETITAEMLDINDVPNPITQPASANLSKPEGGAIADLNFKVDTEFKREFRLYAAEHELTQKEVLIRAFDLLKQQQ